MTRVLLLSGLAVFLILAPLIIQPDQKQNFLSSSKLERANLKQWKLPKRLREISGLALSDDGRLYAHNDESGRIYQLDYKNGNIVSEFRLNKLKADLEGIAVVGSTVYVLSSTGTLYTSALGVDGQTLKYKKIKTGLKSHCEFEGLTFHAPGNTLLLLCKTPYKKKLKQQVVIYSWSLDARAIDKSATIRVTKNDIVDLLGSKNIQPSGITFDERSGHLIMVAAAQQALIEISMSGELINALKFPMHAQHQQAEGIAISPQGLLLIADEGGKRKARLAVYSTMEKQDGKAKMKDTE